jgi:hypothetical protein
MIAKKWQGVLVQNYLETGAVDFLRVPTKKGPLGWLLQAGPFQS